METYTFTARVAERWPSQIQLVPDDPEAFLAYRDRAGLTFDPYWYGDEIYISVGSRQLVRKSGSAERVRYSVTRRGTRMFGVELEPLD